ncbi:MAG TPA: LamG domain-containing protein [Thermoanaerobaculia bacterium]|nr:LamG domain-containing protein [Thermoanaerobaculia bacterium]
MRSVTLSDRGFTKLFVLAVLLVALATPMAQAQPFDAWMTLAGSPNVGYVRIPHSAALNPTGAFTFEAWVAVRNSPASEDCRSIAGKNFLQAWWIGVCTVGGQPTLRSYLKGGSSARNGGIIPATGWTHIAVVFNGAQRLHYINGELAAQFPEAGPLTTSASEMRIGGDISWNPQPQGAIDEVRLWSVARTTAQIRAWLNERIRVAQPGLVAVWPLDASAVDVIGPHDGSVVGAGVGALTFPAGPGCVASASQLCLRNRFGVTARHRAGGAPGSPTTGNAAVAVSSFESGVLSFFGAANWEVLVKALNGCGINNRYWIYAASTTDVFYRMEVFDYQELENKVYFNYPGAPAPALTDSDAFATCP